jgi:hypothetical protein
MTEIHLGACCPLTGDYWLRRIIEHILLAATAITSKRSISIASVTGCNAYSRIWNPKVENHMTERPGGTDIPTLLGADILALCLPTKDPPKRGVHILK